MKWKPGQSGNPHGPIKPSERVDLLARRSVPDAIKFLVDTMNDPAAPWTARLSAASGLLDRAHGRPPTAPFKGKHAVSAAASKKSDTAAAQRIWQAQRAIEKVMSGDAHGAMDAAAAAPDPAGVLE
jgi:hypothetical protein